jgi:hypothetical protein
LSKIINMASKSYQKETIDAFMQNIDTKLDNIHAQVQKTNGRVTTSEFEIGRLKLWRAGFGAILSFCTLILLPLFFIWVKSNIEK